MKRGLFWVGKSEARSQTEEVQKSESTAPRCALLFHEQEPFSFLSPRSGLLVFCRKRVQFTGPSAPKDARLGG